MSAPRLDRSTASAILALVDAARVHAPGHELAWLGGWCMHAAGTPVEPREPAWPEGQPASNGAVLGRVDLRKPGDPRP